jgi:hypothetical protein
MNSSDQYRQVWLLAIVVAFGVVSLGGNAQAADTATQDVDITVQAVNEITVGSTVTLNINTATAGGNPTGTAASTYAITTNSATSKKITAQLVSALAAGLTLSTSLQAPSTGTSAGATSLSTTAADVVTSIEAVAESGLTINYSATATVAVEPNTYAADVTYTIVNDS